MFNLKKQSCSNVEKRLEESNKDSGLSVDDNSGNIDYRLEELRTHPDGMETTQKQLDSVREANENQEITEGALNNTKKGKFNLMKHRVDERQPPLMDYYKTNKKEVVKESEKKRDTDFWDKYVGDQLEGEPTKIVSNTSVSQLVSNYDTREEFEKNNKSIKEASVKLSDSDAMLYYIYRKAALENREINEEEKQIVTDINSGKVRILEELIG